MNPDSTVAVTNTCPKDGVHLFMASPKSRILTLFSTWRTLPPLAALGPSLDRLTTDFRSALVCIAEDRRGPIDGQPPPKSWVQ